MNPIKIEYSISEHVEFKMDFKEKLELVKCVLFQNMENKEFNSAFNSLLLDLVQTEMEFKNRENVINAIKVLLDAEL
jgi:hypothetical protein